MVGLITIVLKLQLDLLKLLKNDNFYDNIKDKLIKKKPLTVHKGGAEKFILLFIMIRLDNQNSSKESVNHTG